MDAHSQTATQCPAMRVGGGDWASTRPKGEEGSTPRTARRHWPPRLSLKPQALGRGFPRRRGPLPWLHFLPRPGPPLQATHPHQSLLSTCSAVSFPYIEFCSQPGKELRQVPGGKKEPVPRDTSSCGAGGRAPSGPGSHPGAGRGPDPFPKPSSLQLRTQADKTQG